MTDYHYQHLVNITLGTPPQSFVVEFDSWSTDWWVIAANSTFKDADGTRNKTRFYANQSSTYVYDGTHFSNMYGFFRRSNDTWTAGPLTLPSIQFGVAEVVTSRFSNESVADSEWGMQFNNNTNSSLYQVLSQLDQKILTKYVNGSNFWLDWQNDDMGTNGSGVYTLGGEDTATCLPNYTYIQHDIDDLGYVILPSFNVSIGGKILESRKDILIDSELYGFATSNLTANAVAAMYGAVYNTTTTYYDIDCDQVNNASINTLTLDLVFDLGVTLKLGLEDFMVYDGHSCFLTQGDWGTDDPDTDWGIGHPFLTNHCMAGDLENMAVGFSHTR